MKTFELTVTADVEGGHKTLTVVEILRVDDRSWVVEVGRGDPFWCDTEDLKEPEEGDSRRGVRR